MASVKNVLANSVAVERVHKNDVKYRFTLVDYDKQFA
jgi:hypothetical protein